MKSHEFNMELTQKLQMWLQSCKTNYLIITNLTNKTLNTNHTATK